MRTSALFGVKNTGIFEIYGVSARTRGSIYRDFMRKSFMAAPNNKYSVLILPRLFFTSNSAVLLVGATKIFLPQGTGYPLATLVA